MDTNSIPRLVSAARREFLIRQSRTPENVKWMEENGTPVSKDEWSGKQMQAMTDLFQNNWLRTARHRVYVERVQQKRVDLVCEPEGV